MNDLISIETKAKEMGMVRSIDGTWSVSSLAVAERFGKQHKNVIQSIQSLEIPEEFSRLNFQPRDYVDERGKEQPYYNLRRDGFTMLAMGFTGSRAMQWKLKYIELFNALESQAMNIDPDIHKALMEVQAITGKCLLNLQNGQAKVEIAVDGLGDSIVDVRRKIDDVDVKVISIASTVDMRLDTFEDHLHNHIQRRELTKNTKDTHLEIVFKSYSGKCPCCMDSQIVNGAGGRIKDCFQYDHWYARNRNGLIETWMVCVDCNQYALKSNRNAFMNAFQQYQAQIEKRINPQGKLDLK